MVVSIMLIWMSVHKGSMVSLNEFLYLYYLKPSTTMDILSFILGIGSLGSSVVDRPQTEWPIMIEIN